MPEDATPFAFNRLEAVSTVSDDRWCEQCGYNLRGQHVRRDERSKLLLVRCPECHTFGYANERSRLWQPWVRRVSSVALVIWILLCLWAAIALVAGQGAMGDMVLHEIQRSQHSAYRGRPTAGDPLQWFIWAMAGLSFGMGLAAAWVMTTVMWYWKRQVVGGIVFTYPLIAMVINGLIWTFDDGMSTYLPDSPWVYLYPLAVTCIVGGVIGMLVGRMLSRQLVRWFVPPKLRHLAAFLWEVDGMTPPTSANATA